jgi:putative membrane protein
MRRSAFWLGVVSVSAALPAAAQDAAPGWRHGSYGMMGDGGWAWMMIFGPLMMIPFVAAVVVLVAFALRWLTGHGPHGTGHAPAAPPARTPLDILKERFARGEIDKAEYEERRRILGE